MDFVVMKNDRMDKCKHTLPYLSEEYGYTQRAAGRIARQGLNNLKEKLYLRYPRLEMSIYGRFGAFGGLSACTRPLQLRY